MWGWQEEESAAEVFLRATTGDSRNARKRLCDASWNLKDDYSTSFTAHGTDSRTKMKVLVEFRIAYVKDESYFERLARLHFVAIDAVFLCIPDRRNRSPQQIADIIHWNVSKYGDVTPNAPWVVCLLGMADINAEGTNVIKKAVARCGCVAIHNICARTGEGIDDAQLANMAASLCKSTTSPISDEGKRNSGCCIV